MPTLLYARSPLRSRLGRYCYSEARVVLMSSVYGGSVVRFESHSATLADADIHDIAAVVLDQGVKPCGKSAQRFSEHSRA